MGHEKKDYRRYLGLCLACGAKDHSIGSCPNTTVRVPTRGRTGPQQQALVRGQGRTVAKDRSAEARGRMFNLIAEDEEIDDVSGEGTLLISNSLFLSACHFFCAFYSLVVCPFSCFCVP